MLKKTCRCTPATCGKDTHFFLYAKKWQRFFTTTFLACYLTDCFIIVYVISVSAWYSRFLQIGVRLCAYLANNYYFCSRNRMRTGWWHLREVQILINTMKTALFPGSFNPFTRGHQDIVARGLRLFDRIIIGVGRNTAKNPHDNADERAAAIAELYASEPRVAVQVYDVLTVDFARAVGADVVLRGVRNTTDFEYERQMADVNRLIGDLETVCLFAAPDKVEISSSLVRELQAFGKDVSDYLPSAGDVSAGD